MSNYVKRAFLIFNEKLNLIRDEEAPRKITDPDAEMPDNWLEDEPQYIDDPDSAKPEDWDEDMDGEWEAPKVGFFNELRRS